MAAVCRVRCCCRRCSHLGGPAAQKTKPHAASLAYYAEEMSPAVRCTQPSLTGTTPPWKMCPAQETRLFCNFLQILYIVSVSEQQVYTVIVPVATVYMSMTETVG